MLRISSALRVVLRFSFWGSDTGITITKAGIILFNVVAKTKSFGEIKKAQLYFGADERKMGIKPVQAKDAPHTVNLLGGRTASMNRRGFLSTAEIDYSETRRYAAVWDEQEQMLVVDLKAPLNKS